MSDNFIIFVHGGILIERVMDTLFCEYDKKKEPSFPRKWESKKKQTMDTRSHWYDRKTKLSFARKRESQIL